MTIKHALVKYKNIEIDLLLAFVLKKSREFLYMHPEYRLTRKEENRLTRMIKRRKSGEPIAYILGFKDFYGLRFKVNKNVLIPRPETEFMVERVVQALGLLNQTKQKQQAKGLHYKDRISILDVGTGSGCIAVSIASLLNKYPISNAKYQITASDVSKKALKVARQNALAHKVKIKFIHSNILQNVGMNFDIIVANLPYVPETDYRLLIKDLRFEPKDAIFAKENGLEIIHKFLIQISRSKILNPKSSIWLEFDPRQKKLLHQLIKKTLPAGQCNFYKDLNNFWRFVQITSSLHT